MNTTPFAESSVNRRRGRFDVKPVRPAELSLAATMPSLLDPSLLTDSDARKLATHLAETVQTPAGPRPRAEVYAEEKFTGVRQMVVVARGRPALRWALDRPYGAESVIVPAVVAKACVLNDSTDWASVTRFECARAMEVAGELSVAARAQPASLVAQERYASAQTAYLTVAVRSADLNLDEASRDATALRAAGILGTSENVEEMELRTFARGHGRLTPPLHLRLAEAEERVAGCTAQVEVCFAALATWSAQQAAGERSLLRA